MQCMCFEQVLAPPGFGKDIRSQPSVAMTVLTVSLTSVEPQRIKHVSESAVPMVSPKKADTKFPAPPKIARLPRDDVPHG